MIQKNQISFRISEADLIILKNASKNVGLSKGGFCRMASLEVAKRKIREDLI